MSEARCSYLWPDGRACHWRPEWSVHREGTHPSQTFEACENHLARLLEPGKRYTVFPALSALPEDGRV